MQTVTHAVVQEVINNTGLSWVNAVAWCDNNLLPQWRTRPQQQAVKLTIESDSDEENTGRTQGEDQGNIRYGAQARQAVRTKAGDNQLPWVEQEAAGIATTSVAF